MPKRLTEFNSFSQNLDFLLRAGWSIRWQKLHVHDGIEIFVVSVLQNRFKNVLAKIAHKSTPSNLCIHRAGDAKHLPKFNWGITALLPESSRCGTNLYRVKRSLHPQKFTQNSLTTRDYWQLEIKVKKINQRTTQLPLAAKRKSRNTERVLFVTIRHSSEHALSFQSTRQINRQFNNPSAYRLIAVSMRFLTPQIG